MAGASATPQIVAPGCYDLVDIVGSDPVPEKWRDHVRHAHNRLITSVVLNEEERRAVARAHADQLKTALGPVAMILPDHGLGEWDRQGADLHDQAGLDAFLDEMRSCLPVSVARHDISCHINDAAFADKALEIFDAWCAQGHINTPT